MASPMSESRFAPILRSELSELQAYEPLAGNFEIRLDANESPPLISPEASAALARASVPTEWNRYPDSRAVELREALAEHVGARADEILVGAGSDEVIALLLTALDRPRARASAPSILIPSPTFVMYQLSARARGFRVLAVPLDRDWDLDVAGMQKAIEIGRPNVIFIASPNNPTSMRLSHDRIEAVIQAANEALVILDEAYAAFAPEAEATFFRKHPNVALLGTLSKLGFASLRVGWMVGPAELVRELDKVRQPFNLSVPSQRGALFVLRELGAEVLRMRDLVVAERARLSAELTALGFEVSPSAANFVWIKTQRPAEEVWSELAARRILVKSFHTTGGRLAHQLRITVGLPAENDRLLAEIASCA
jgi:histidinol-phosphate aminotransferase